MGQQKLEIMREYLDLIAKGEWEKASEFCTDDVTLHVSGNNPVSGDYHGRDGFRQYIAKALADVEEWSFEPHDLLASEDHVVALAKIHWQRRDVSLDTNRVVVYHLEGDKISELWLIDEDQQAANEFLS